MVASLGCGPERIGSIPISCTKELIMRSVKYHVKDRNLMKILPYMAMDSFSIFKIERKYMIDNLTFSIKDGASNEIFGAEKRV